MSNILVDKLPLCLKEDEESKQIAEALTDGIAAIIDQWLLLLEEYESRYLNPSTALPEWLDYLAHQLGWGGIWKSEWEENIKRELLANSFYIWRNRGNRDIVPYLLKIFNIEGDLTQSTGWKMGVSALPASLQSNPFSYVLKIPSSYTETSAEFKIITLIIDNFTPCWTRIDIERI